MTLLVKTQLPDFFIKVNVSYRKITLVTCALKKKLHPVERKPPQVMLLCLEE